MFPPPLMLSAILAVSSSLVLLLLPPLPPPPMAFGAVIEVSFTVRLRCHRVGSGGNEERNNVIAHLYNDDPDGRCADGRRCEVLAEKRTPGYGMLHIVGEKNT